MRQLIIDTETTGLNPKTGDRIVEVGCVELLNRRLTGNNLHFYINPERDSDPAALAVHGLTSEFLRDKPKFAEIAAQLREFVQDTQVIIHNAPFDLGFFDAEFALLGLPSFCEHCGPIIDTLLQAKSLFPGKRNSLDALCERLGISNAHRTLHGALLDAELLAEVYLAMTRGQESLMIEILTEPPAAKQLQTDATAFETLDLPIIAANPDELEAHRKVLDALEHATQAPCVWRKQPALA